MKKMILQGSCSEAVLAFNKSDFAKLTNKEKAEFMQLIAELHPIMRPSHKPTKYANIFDKKNMKELEIDSKATYSNDLGLDARKWKHLYFYQTNVAKSLEEFFKKYKIRHKIDNPFI